MVNKELSQVVFNGDSMKILQRKIKMRNPCFKKKSDDASELVRLVAFLRKRKTVAKRTYQIYNSVNKRTWCDFGAPFIKVLE